MNANDSDYDKKDKMKEWIKRLEKDSDCTMLLAAIVFLAILCIGSANGVGKFTSFIGGLIMAWVTVAIIRNLSKIKK